MRVTHHLTGWHEDRVTEGISRYVVGYVVNESHYHHSLGFAFMLSVSPTEIPMSPKIMCFVSVICYSVLSMTENPQCLQVVGTQ